MGYIVKLLGSESYFTAGEDGIDTTDSRQHAIDNGQFDDYESAQETAESWSGQMQLGRDYIIEKV